MEKDIRKMTVTELGNEIYLFSKKLQAEQSQLSQMEKLYAEKYNAEQEDKKGTATAVDCKEVKK